MNTYYLQRTSQKWTWYKWNEVDKKKYTDKSMMNLFVINNKNMFEYKAIASISFDSDHRMVLAKLKTEKPRKKVKKKTKRIQIENLKKLTEIIAGIRQE